MSDGDDGAGAVTHRASSAPMDIKTSHLGVARTSSGLDRMVGHISHRVTTHLPHKAALLRFAISFSLTAKTVAPYQYN